MIDQVLVLMCPILARRDPEHGPVIKMIRSCKIFSFPDLHERLRQFEPDGSHIFELFQTQMRDCGRRQP